MLPGDQQPPWLQVLNEEIVSCFRCPRLVAHREQIGIVQRRAYRGQSYWCRPVPGFGDPQARLLLVGLAPGAHGANRTGRMFTGDKSGEFLYRSLWQSGFANQSSSDNRNDGLQLRDAYITAALRCVPPDNKPTQDEIVTCRRFLARELADLPNVRVVVALGNIALQAYLSVLQNAGKITARSRFAFGHGVLHQPEADGPLLLTSYHPSQQNTSTRKLTAEMLRDLFLQARELLGGRAVDSAPEIVVSKTVKNV